jgi:hypothetical protein
MAEATAEAPVARSYVSMFFVDRTQAAGTERVSAAYLRERRILLDRLLAIYKYAEQKVAERASTAPATAATGAGHSPNCSARTSVHVCDNPLALLLKANKTKTGYVKKRVLMAMCIGPCQSHGEAEQLCEKWKSAVSQPRSVERMIPQGLALAEQGSLGALINVDAVYGVPSSLLLPGMAAGSRKVDCPGGGGAVVVSECSDHMHKV